MNRLFKREHWGAIPENRGFPGFIKRSIAKRVRTTRSWCAERRKTLKGRIEKAIETYYQKMGWNKNGAPTKAKLEELGVEWIADKLEK